MAARWFPPDYSRCSMATDILFESFFIRKALTGDSIRFPVARRRLKGGSGLMDSSKWPPPSQLYSLISARGRSYSVSSTLFEIKR